VSKNSNVSLRSQPLKRIRRLDNNGATIRLIASAARLVRKRRGWAGYGPKTLTDSCPERDCMRALGANRGKYAKRYLSITGKVTEATSEDDHDGFMADVWGRSRGAVVVVQHAAQTLASLDRSIKACRNSLGGNEPVAQPLMISFPMVMSHELSDRFPQSPRQETVSVDPGTTP
jgi:fermentation-respiration switch protein FrsA (DUF1100 family)